MKLQIIAMASAMLLNGAAAWSAINPQPATKHVAAGSLETFTIYSPELERDVTVEVLLPEGYDGLTPHPVLYMHDGQNLYDAPANWNHRAWAVDSALTRLDCLPPIVVGVYSQGSTRVGDLMPTEAVQEINPATARRLLDRWMALDIKGDKYVDFLAGTLKSEIDGHYATLADAAHTSVMGSSMGGLASMYALCRHPETFGGAACLSTHFTGLAEPNEVFPTAFAAYLLKHLPLDGRHRIYFDTGDQTIDANYGPYFDRIMLMIGEMGMPDSLFMHRKFPGHAHEENSWASRVDIPLNFLLQCNANQ